MLSMLCCRGGCAVAVVLRQAAEGLEICLLDLLVRESDGGGVESDAPDWGDEMTLDYNFEASFSFDVGFMRERGCNID